MINKVRSHTDFLTFVSNEIDLLYPNEEFIRDHFADLIIWTSLIDLTPTAELLKTRYSSNPRGRKPRNPCDMLRSLLLMRKLQYSSVDKWVKAMKTIPLYAVLSGFDPDSTLGVGTFYDFFNRLWLAPSSHLMKKKRRKIKKPKKKGKKNQKMAPKNPSIVEKLVRRALRQRKLHYSPKAHDGLQTLFKTIFIGTICFLGLGDLRSLSILGDGTPVETGGRPYGKFLCSCRKQGNWKCDCLRQFSDPDANYGWDSSREKYYYGRNLFMVGASKPV